MRFVLVLLLFVAGPAVMLAQHKGSFDVAAARKLHTRLNGLNLSYFHFFTEKVALGLECNRFFETRKFWHEKEVDLSAWDLGVNIHYLFPLTAHMKGYPIVGVSHISERETEPESKECKYERLWTTNTGAGVSWEFGHWTPHLEFTYSWGKVNQQLILVGLSYEINWTH